MQKKPNPNIEAFLTARIHFTYLDFLVFESVHSVFFGNRSTILYTDKRVLELYNKVYDIIQKYGFSEIPIVKHTFLNPLDILTLFKALLKKTV